MDLTSVNAADYTLTGSETITFSSAFIDSDNLKLVHLSDPSSTITADTTLDNIADAENDTDFGFYAGVTPIAMTNTLNPGGHIQNDYLATFAGDITADDGYNNVWLSDYPGNYNGVLIYDYDLPDSVEVGDGVMFTAKRDEYYGLTELTAPNLLSVVSGDIITPTIIPGSDIDSTLAQNTNPGEQWESQLVKIEDVEVATPVDTNITYVGSDDGWQTTFIIGDNVDYQFDSTGDILDNVISTGEAVDIVGVIDYDWGSYRLNPRDSSDITGYTSADPDPNPQAVTLNHYPNPVNSSTTISFNLPSNFQNNPVIKVYNLQGQLIKILHPEENYVNWNCTNEKGIRVANGIYFYSLQTDAKTVTNKMILMK